MSNDEYEKMTLDALQARLSSLPKSNLNSPEYNALLAAINKKSKEKEVQDKAEAQRKHEETIAESRRSNKLSIGAIAISILSLLVALVALIIAYKSLTLEQQKLKTELHKQPQVVSQPTDTMSAK